MNWFTTYDLLKRSGPFTFAPDYIVWYILAAIAVGVGIFFLNKYKTEKRVKIVLIVLWAIAVFIDIVKLIVNLCTDFSIKYELPLVICSLFMYVMPFAIWGKGKFKTMGCAYVCSIGLFGSIANYVTPTVIPNYSIFSFFGFHTTLYHTILWAVPLIMLCTGYYKFKFKDYGWTFLGFFVITLPVLIFDLASGLNYMYFKEGILSPIIAFAHKVGYAWPLFMYAIYAVIMILMQLIAMGVTKLVELIKTKFNIGFKPKQEVAGETAVAETKPAEKVETEKKNE